MSNHLYGSIELSVPGPSYNRFKIAYEIQDACNPSGVARELVRVIKSAMDDPACEGTNWVRKDAAVVAVVDKLYSLCARDPYDCLRECREKSGGL